MKIRKCIIVFLCAVFVLPLAACKEHGSDVLDRNVTTYRIDATYDGMNTVTASAEITYVNNYDVGLPELKFHLYPNAFREGAKYQPVHESERAAAFPRGASYGGIAISNLSRGGEAVEVTLAGEDEDILAVPLDSVLQPMSSVTVRMDFTLTLPYARHRFGMTDKSVNLGNWYPIACVYSGGGFLTDPYYATGDPFYSEIANYEVKLTAPGSMNIAATGSSTSATEGDKTVCTASARAVRDFAAVIGTFDVATVKTGDVDVQYFYYDDSEAEASLQTAADALTVFSEKYGAYPYDTYTVVQTGFLQGGMEYPQLVMISDALNPSLYKEAIVHETAHQWFYGLVGNDQIRTPWLDEALAEYSTYLFYKWKPEYEVPFEDKIADTLSGFILYCDVYKHGGRDDTSMTRALNEYDNQSEYTYLTYAKGALLFDSLRRTIGDVRFEAALKSYVETYFLQTATPDCLIACFEKTAGRDLKGFFDSWTSGKVMLYGD